MTFERFYSIIKPHKAVLFNTVKRAKATIVIVVIVSVFFNIPHLFTTSETLGECTPIRKGIDHIYGQIYSWLTSLLNFFLPFVLLLVMNIVIILTLRTRSELSQSQGQFEGQVEGNKIKHADKQITVTLLHVTFTFLVLKMPACLILIYVIVFDFTQSPQAFAGYYLFGNIAGQAYFTNSGINFFLYVISGRKFRTDLPKLCLCQKIKQRIKSSSSVENNVSSDITNIT